MTDSPFDAQALAADPRRRGQALDIAAAALKAANPHAAVLRALRLENSVLTVAGQRYDLDAFRAIKVVGAGKAGAPMSQAVEELLGARVEQGLVVVKDHHALPTRVIETCEASHPVPDDRGVRAGRRMLEMARSASERDLVITLLSGGGSALLVAPAPGISLEDMQRMTQLLLAAGATINEINCLRKHCSSIKGGQLARALHPATCLTLAVSDVIGSPLDVIASGPTVPDRSTWDEARELVDKFRLAPDLPPSIAQRLEQGGAGLIEDTPKPDDAVFRRAQATVIADNRGAAEAAAAQARQRGFRTRIMTTFLEGEAKEVAKALAGFAREVRAFGNPVPPPACLIFGGETTVTLGAEHGRGGRNQELALAAAFALRDLPDTLLVALATDGTDGPTDSAGAIVDSRTIARGLDLQLAPQQHLDRHDAYPYLERVGDLLVTGPTYTNVNDLLMLCVWA